MKNRIYLIFGIFTFLFNTSAAQDHWEVQFRPGLNIITEDFAGANIKTGFGFKVTGAYHFTPRFGVNAGWGWNEFKAEDRLANSNFDVEVTGYSVGLQYKSHIQNSSMSYFFQGGAFTTTLKLKIQTEILYETVTTDWDGKLVLV